MGKIDADVLKNSKPFKKFDLLVYLSVLVLIFSLFLCYNTCSGGEIEKLSISRGGTTLFVYDFSDGTYEIFSENVSVEESGVLTVTVLTEDRTGQNVVEIDKNEKSARVTDADCSARKDCVHSPAIKKAGASIVCVPHGLVISADGNGGIDRPVVG